MTDHLLTLNAALAQDREIFAGIVRRYQNLVTALTFSMTGNLQQSEDLAQETFVAAWRSLTGGESRPEVAAENPGPWLCGIARNLTNNWLRRTTRERQTPHIPAEGNAISDLPAVTDSPDAVLSDHETELSREMQATLVWETLRHIPATYREPLVMFYRQDASIREIADALGLSEACVKQRLSRGRTMLKGEVASRFESFLTHIRPGEHFTVAVLAAIPILATGKQAMAASAAGLAVAQTATSSGSGHPLIAGITTACWTFITSVGPFLVVFLGTLLGVWSGARHAPTRRARLLMIRTVLEYYVLCSGVLTFLMLMDFYIIPYIGRYYELNRDPFMTYNQNAIILFFGTLSLSILLNSIRVNRKWRQIVEFDCGIREKEPCAVTRKNMAILLVVALLVNLVYFGIIVDKTEYLSMMLYCGMNSPFDLTWVLILPGALLFFPTVLILFLYCSWRISCNDTAFEKTPPRLPNLLPILTGEQPWPGGFRNRITFWGDLVGIGLGMICMQVFSVGSYFRFRGLPAYFTLLGLPMGNGNLLLLVSLLAYFGFAIFFAGIPRRRYWGMIILAGTIFACNTFMICYAKLWQHVYWSEFAMVFGLNAWYLLCFALAGAAGLWVFRKKPEHDEKSGV